MGGGFKVSGVKFNVAGGDRESCTAEGSWQLLAVVCDCLQWLGTPEIFTAEIGETQRGRKFEPRIARPARMPERIWGCGEDGAQDFGRGIFGQGDGRRFAPQRWERRRGFPEWIRTTPLLGVRLKALRQIAVLYDVNPKRKAKAQDPRFEPVEPATPEEISELVRKWREEREVRGVKNLHPPFAAFLRMQKVFLLIGEQMEIGRALWVGSF